MKINRSTDIRPVLTQSEYFERLEASIGYCVKCGANRGNTEPDATEYECEACKQFTVYGIDYLMIIGFIELRDEEDPSNGQP